MSSRSSFPLPLFLALTSLLLIVFLPLARAQFNMNSPACCRDCYAAVLGRVSGGEFDGLTVGDTSGRCSSSAFNDALSKCWTETCDSDADVSEGMSLWNAACDYASSTAGKSPLPVKSSVMASLVDHIATETTFAKMDARGLATALPALEKRDLDSAAPATLKPAYRTSIYLVTMALLVAGFFYAVAA
ncbi:hypothetical protein JCM6882_009700 [Rhodosporidiobolus microsporus]